MDKKLLKTFIKNDKHSTINRPSPDLFIKTNKFGSSLPEEMPDLPEGACFVSISPLTSPFCDGTTTNTETISVENVMISCDKRREPTRFHEPEKVICAEYDHNGMKYLVKWKDRDEPDYVSGREARLRFPHLVIDFYEGVESSTFTNMLDNMSV